jgi:hypothetical protein
MPIGQTDFAGNGKMGVIVFGNPLDETVIYNDRKFFLAASRERSFSTVSAADLERIRNFCAEEKWKEANDLADKVHCWTIHEVERQVSACTSQHRRKQVEWMVCNYEM